MTVCIDTNVVLGMSGRNGPWLPIRQALIEGRLIWAVTTEILLETIIKFGNAHHK